MVKSLPWTDSHLVNSNCPESRFGKGTENGKAAPESWWGKRVRKEEKRWKVLAPHLGGSLLLRLPVKLSCPCRLPGRWARRYIYWRFPSGTNENRGLKQNTAIWEIPFGQNTASRTWWLFVTHIQFSQFYNLAAFGNVASWDFLLISSLTPGGESFPPTQWCVDICCEG